MKTEIFLNTLKNNLDKELLFEYSPDTFVNANYHITEIKNTTIDSVDCGGKTNFWKETIVQLWENPLEVGKRTFMTVSKAIEIFDRVDSIKPLLLDTEIKIEYGNSSFHTANLVIQAIIENDKSIIVKLHSDSTQCKANDFCCETEKEIKENETCCTPSESNCC